MEKTLQGEIKELGYPKAALFSFCVALLSYNVMSTVKAALVVGAWRETVWLRRKFLGLLRCGRTRSK